MASERVERRLVAILAADVVSYSRMMEADDEGTLARLNALQRGVFEPTTRRYGGRIFKTMGDGTLVEFPSAVDAVSSAVAIQHALTERDVDGAEDSRIRLRIGISLGEVIVEGSDLYGDTVNVAARMETLAEPGGVCISGSAYDHVAGKIDAGFDDLGPQMIKNIARPIRVLRVRPASGVKGDQVTDVSAPVPGFQGRPAIAVLPLQNLSGDPEQDYFADGIAEDILTRLAMWRWCPIIARNSSFAYRGTNVDIRQIGRELGARYVLEGSVRKAGDRVRITGQLIDAENGHHVWAERYDRDLEDIFAVQDEIVDEITAALEPAVGQAETRKASLKPPSSLDAWELFHRALWHWSRATREDLVNAREYLEQAIGLDPGFASPHSALAVIGTFEVLFAASKNPQETLQEALREGQLAANLDSMDAFAHVGLCQALVFVRQHDTAIAAGNHAIDLNPSLALAHHVRGVALFFSGKGSEAVESILRGIRLSPHDVLLPHLFMGLGAANLTACNYDAAIKATTTSLGMLGHNALCLRFHASALGHAGRLEEARAALQKSVALAPGLSTEMLRRATPYRDDADFEHYAEGLRKAGWTG